MTQGAQSADLCGPGSQLNLNSRPIELDMFKSELSTSDSIGYCSIHFAHVKGASGFPLYSQSALAHEASQQVARL